MACDVAGLEESIIMPQSNSALRNCYRLSVYGEVVGYFKSYVIAVNICDRLWKTAAANGDTKIEPWFIAEEF